MLRSALRLGTRWLPSRSFATPVGKSVDATPVIPVTPTAPVNPPSVDPVPVNPAPIVDPATLVDPAPLVDAPPPADPIIPHVDEKPIEPTVEAPREEKDSAGEKEQKKSGFRSAGAKFFQAVMGASVGVGLYSAYHVNNLKQDIKDIDWYDAAKFGTFGAFAMVAARNPTWLIKELPSGYESLIRRSPLVTKSVTTGVTYALGDLLAQWIERGKEGADVEAGYDWQRAAVFFTFGTFMAGPVYTIWFDKIDRLPYMIYSMKQEARREHIQRIVKYAADKGVMIPQEIAKTPELHRVTYIGSKILADQFVFSSLYTAYFFYGVGVVGGKTFKECNEDLKHKFIPTYATDCAVWPLLQMVNFTLVPQHLRVLYVNVCNVFWNAFLSSMANASHHSAPHKAPALAHTAPRTVVALPDSTA